MAEPTSIQTSADGAPSGFASALRTILQPLAHLLLEKQLTYTSLLDVVKRVFVQVAEHDMVIEGRRQTDSRISLLTGIHRKDVKRLRREIAEDVARPSRASLGALVVSRWTGAPEFLSPDGRPQPLPRVSENGPSFDSLVSSVTADIPACSLLDEWLRLGVVERDTQGNIHLSQTSFVPDRGFGEKLHFFGRNLHDHIAAGTHNLLEQGPPFLDRSVFYDRLSEQSTRELAAMAREEGAALLQRVNQRAFELQQRDEEANDATHRMTMGTYFFATDVRPHED